MFSAGLTDPFCGSKQGQNHQLIAILKARAVQRSAIQGRTGHNNDFGNLLGGITQWMVIVYRFITREQARAQQRLEFL